MKWKRWLLATLVLLLLLVGGLFIAARIYLSSTAVALKVQKQLEEELGVPVRIGSASVGLFGSTTVRDVHLHESEANANAWLKVREITTDISALDVLRDKVSPSRVTLKGVEADLRFDEEGNLLTELPTLKKKEKPSKVPRLPAITVDGAQLTVHQEGRPAFVLRGADLHLTESGDVQTLKGTINDPDWGTLTLEGRLGPVKGQGELILRGDRVHVTTERLKSVPLVSPTIWKQVQAKGDTRAEVRLTLKGEEETYKVTLEPQGVTIDVAAVHEHFTKTFGRILIEDEVVKLRDMRGQAAEGEVLLSGDLDFREEVDKLHFDVTVKHARMEELAQKWNVPQPIRDIKGKLTGHADLTITVGDTVHTEGQGKGKIEDARIGDIPTDGPVTLNLRYKDGKAEFSTQTSSSSLGRPRGLIEARSASKGVPSLALRALVRMLVLAAPPAALPPAPRKVTYFDLNFGFKDIELAELIKRLNLELPFPVSGRGSFHIHASLPVNRPKDVALYKLTGTLDLGRVKAAGLELEKVTARLKLDKGLLQLTQLKGEWARKAHFTGTAQAKIAPLGDASALLNLMDIPLDQVASVVPSVRGKLGGSLNADLNLRAPVKSLGDAASWNGQLAVRADRLEAFGWGVDQVSLKAVVKDGELTVPSIKGGLEGLQVTGSARASLRGHYPFEGRVSLEKADLAALERLARGVKLPVAVKGQLTLGASARGTLSPLAIDAGGDVEADSLQINKVTVQSFSAAWKADTRTLKLDKIQAKLYDGQVTGSASAPLKELAAGSVNLRIADLDLGALSKNIGKFPVRIAGKASGTLAGTLSGALPGKPRELTTKVDIKAPRLRVQNIPADRLHGTVDYRNGVVQYKLEGETLGGTFDVEGQLPPPGERSSSAAPLPPGAVAFVQAQPPAGGGRFRFRGLRLGRLWEALHVQGFFSKLTGRLDVTLDYQLGARPEDTTGKGTVVLTNLRWGDRDLVSRLAGGLRLQGERLTLPELSGILGEGLFRATAGVNLRQPERNWFGIHLEGIRAEQLVGIFPGLENSVEGPLDVNVRGHLGERWQGHGEAVLTHGKVVGAEIAEWRLPFSFEFGPGEGGGRLDVRDTHAQLGLGRADGELHASFDGSMRLNGRLRFLRVELRNVFRSIDETLPVGTGRVSGLFTFSGQDVRSINDVSGRLTATFSQSQALEFPGLRQIAPYLRLTPSLRIDKGDMRAYLSRGVLRIDRLALSGNYLKLFAEGTVLVASGRLNLAVIARTGLVLVAGPVLQVLGVAAVGAVPVAALVRASAWLSNWTIRLRVTGTLRSPSVQVEPLTQLLTAEIIRFFLYQYTLPFGAASNFVSSP
jgi:translocation and assembly module TamB